MNYQSTINNQQSIQVNAALVRLDFLWSGGVAYVLCRGMGTANSHFAGLPVESPFVPHALRATPNDPVALALGVAGVYVVRQAVYLKVFHCT